MAAIQSRNNSTSVVLADSAVFVGKADDVLRHGGVRVYVLTVGTAGTLYLEISPDNIKWNASARYPVYDGVPLTVSKAPVAQYYRTRFANSTGTQTALTVQTTYEATYEEQTNTYSVSTTQAVGNSTEWFMLVSLHDSTRWPHRHTSAVIVKHISYSVRAGELCNGTLDIGVARKVGARSGSVDFICRASWANISPGSETETESETEKKENKSQSAPSVIQQSLNFEPHGINCTVVGEALAFHLSSNRVSDTDAISTNISLRGPVSAAPSEGDLLMRIVNSHSNQVEATVTLGYCTT